MENRVQQKRFRDSSTRNNAGKFRGELEMYSKPSDNFRKLHENAISRMGLSARAFDRILKVALTIADLAESVNVETPLVTEAVHYRNLDWPVYVWCIKHKFFS